MGLRKKVAIVGMGNCGNQIANLANKKYGDIFDVVHINSSDSDLSQVEQNVLRFRFGEGVLEGSGLDRAEAKKYFKKEFVNILNDERFSSLINEKRYVFIVSSAGGGTGSGSATLFMDVLQASFPDVNFILVAILPIIKATSGHIGNARKYCNELYSGLAGCTYMIYDNETTSNLSLTRMLEVVNEEVVEDFRALTRVDYYPTPYESIDEADLEKILTTPGRLIVTRVTKGITEKVLEDSTIDDIIIKALKNSKHAETNRDKKLLRCGIVTYFTESVYKLYGSNLEKLMEFTGTPIERFNHNAVNKNDENMNFLFYIASGMSPITDRIQKIDDRAAELALALAAAKPAEYVNSDENSDYTTVDKIRADRRERSKSTDRINLQSIVDKY